MVKNEQSLIKLGERLKKARIEAKLTQAQVAEKAGLNVNYYARIERGELNPSYENLQSIGLALKLKSLDIS